MDRACFRILGARFFQETRRIDEAVLVHAHQGQPIEFKSFAAGDFLSSLRPQRHVSGLVVRQHRLLCAASVVKGGSQQTKRNP